MRKGVWESKPENIQQVDKKLAIRKRVVKEVLEKLDITSSKGRVV